MKPNHSDIQPLLAAKLRPQRLAPHDSRRRAGGSLRISHVDAHGEPHAIDSKKQECARILDEVVTIAGALAAAEGALGSILLHLREIERIVRIAEKPSSDSTEILAHQRRLDERIECIESLAQSKSPDGGCLLDGSWSAALVEASTNRHRTIRIPSFNPNHIAVDQRGRSLASLRSSSELALAGSGAAESRTIVHAAIQAANQVGAQVREFNHSIVEPLRNALSIAITNFSSARAALVNVSFAFEAGQLSRIDALIGAFNRRPASSGARLSVASPPTDP